eukprot:358310-Karenia_brevis.AAC.1
MMTMTMMMMTMTMTTMTMTTMTMTMMMMMRMTMTLIMMMMMILTGPQTSAPMDPPLKWEGAPTVMGPWGVLMSLATVEACP